MSIEGRDERRDVFSQDSIGPYIHHIRTPLNCSHFLIFRSPLRDPDYRCFFSQRENLSDRFISRRKRVEWSRSLCDLFRGNATFFLSSLVRERVFRSVRVPTSGVYVFVSPMAHYQVHVPSIEQRQSRRILTVFGAETVLVSGVP